MFVYLKHQIIKRIEKIPLLQKNTTSITDIKKCFKKNDKSVWFISLFINS